MEGLTDPVGLYFISFIRPLYRRQEHQICKRISTRQVLNNTCDIMYGLRTYTGINIYKYSVLLDLYFDLF